MKDSVVRALIARSGNQCAFPGCSACLFDDDQIFVGQVCHIVSAKRMGPRSESLMQNVRSSTFQPEEYCRNLNKYDNLILLCYAHHRKIDLKPEEYSVEYLKNIKKEHEDKIRMAVSSDSKSYPMPSAKEYEKMISEVVSSINRISWRDIIRGVVNSMINENYEYENPYFSDTDACSIIERAKTLDRFSRVIRFVISNNISGGRYYLLGESVRISAHSVDFLEMLPEKINSSEFPSLENIRMLNVKLLEMMPERGYYRGIDSIDDLCSSIIHQIPLIAITFQCQFIFMGSVTNVKKPHQSVCPDAFRNRVLEELISLIKNVRNNIREALRDAERHDNY